MQGIVAELWNMRWTTDELGPRDRVMRRTATADTVIRRGSAAETVIRRTGRTSDSIRRTA